MAKQISTSVSEIVLVGSILYFLINVIWYNTFTCIGLSVQGVAASLGIVRFAQNRPTGTIYEYHKLASWLAQVVGLPLLAVGFCYKYLPIMMSLNIMAMAATLIVSLVIAPGMRELATGVCSGLAMLTILLVCLRSWNMYGLYGVVAYVLSGAIGSDGQIVGVYRVDLLHYVLAVGNVFFTWAVKEL